MNSKEEWADKWDQIAELSLEEKLSHLKQVEAELSGQLSQSETI